MNYHVIIRVVNDESRIDERPNPRRAFVDPLACRGSCEGILNWRRNNSEGGTSRGADFTNGCQRSGDPACTRSGRRRVHRRERWWTRRSPSEAGKAEALRAGRDVFAKRTQFLCSTRPMAEADWSPPASGSAKTWERPDFDFRELKARVCCRGKLASLRQIDHPTPTMGIHRS